MFPGYRPHVVDIFYLPLVFDHPHGDGIIADLRSDVALDFEAQLFEHMVACRGRIERDEGFRTDRQTDSITLYVPVNAEGTDAFGNIADEVSGTNQPVAMPSKRDSTLMGRRWAASMEGYILWGSWVQTLIRSQTT